ncbi:MAG: hypothetical protein KGZ83_09600 [Sulfuricella sp.]|nr:hypothetical protein [Sulfuricella sp.]
MEETEREIWCQAWRLFREHGDETGSFIATEITRSLHAGDSEAVSRWRRVGDAVAELAS